MSARTRIRAVGLGLSSVLILGALPLLAQEPAEPTSTPQPAPRASTLGRRVPPYFGKVGVTQEQKERIYAIRAEHQQKIVDLQQQIDTLKAQEMAECEAVLTEPQRKMLAQLRPVRKGKSGLAPNADANEK